jgi:hypothetical protein
MPVNDADCTPLQHDRGFRRIAAVDLFVVRELRSFAGRT